MKTTKEIRPVWNKEDGAYYIYYILHAEDISFEFCVRTPSVKNDWNYYLPMGVNYHSKYELYEDQSRVEDCRVINQPACYCDGSTLAGQELWERFEKNGDEQVIWNILERYALDVYPRVLEARAKHRDNHLAVSESE